jgi:nicotinate-nucleotide pyrophosphorylase (carboxylating)
MSYNRILIEEKLKEFLEEDCRYIDVSSKFIPENSVSSAKIIAKSKGYVSGLEEIKILYGILNIDVTFQKKDGDVLKKGDIIAIIKGKTTDILLGERVGLNLITHMSSITSTVKKFVKIIEDSGKNVKIACTRKTIPNLRIFEKKAVEIGGGDTHRYSLDDMVLLKDTHLRYYNGDIKKLLDDVLKTASFSKKIEIEVEKVDDVLIAAENGADIIMLDNMSPDLVEDAINLLKQNNLRDKVIIEVSGGISVDNIVDYLVSGNVPDIISSGEITLFPSERVDVSIRFD